MQADRPLILVAEDDAEIRHLLRERLHGAGYDVRLVRSGGEAITALKASRFDAVVLDINMPEADGFSVLQVCTALRPPPPVLMLTARHAGEDVRRAIALGAKDYLTKPFTEAQLMTRVARLMRIAAAPSAPTAYL